MHAEKSIDFTSLSGLTWHENGQSSLSGKLLRLLRHLDAMVLALACDLPLAEYRFPPFIAAEKLQKLDYFKNFPHLITMPVVPEKSSLEAFAGAPLSADGSINLPPCCPPKEVLTPAACYHFYSELEGRRLSEPLYLTTLATCFRREAEYIPLQRQWAFSMREVVCIGNLVEVNDFLDRFRLVLELFFQERNWPVVFKTATDPFFNPSSNSKYLLQKLDPVKHEMVYRDELAIGSINFHRNYFGDAFKITRDGEEAFSACVAFGLERWIYAMLNEYGENEQAWIL